MPWIAVNGERLPSIDWARADLPSRDAALILTAHAGYDWAQIVREARLVIDTRNATEGVPSTRNTVRL